MTQPYFFYRNNGGLKKVNMADIQYLQSDNNYTRIHEAGGYHEVRIPLKTALEQLNSNRFVRVHRSYVIAVDKIDLITREFIFLSFDPQHKIPFSESYISNLLKHLDILGPQIALGEELPPEED